MRAALLPLSLVLSALAGGCVLSPVLEGDGVPGERVEKVPAVSVVAAAGDVRVDVQPAEAPFARVACDENLLSAIIVEVDGDRLTVHTRGPGGGSVTLAPQVDDCGVEIGMPAVEAVFNTGSGDMRVGGAADCADDAGPLTRADGSATADCAGWDTLTDATLTGSGSLWLAGPVSPSRLALTLTGSGDLQADAAFAATVEARLTGSGDLWVEDGSADTLEARLSGSGDLDLRALRAADATLALTGSGDLAATVLDSVDVTLTGSGDVEIWGDPPQRSRQRTGSGEIHFRR